MIIAFAELMYCTMVARLWPFSIILSAETATAAPRSSKTIETVVDVGRPYELKRSSRMTSVSITARKMATRSGMVKNWG